MASTLIHCDDDITTTATTIIDDSTSTNIVVSYLLPLKFPEQFLPKLTNIIKDRYIIYASIYNVTYTRSAENISI